MWETSTVGNLKVKENQGKYESDQLGRISHKHVPRFDVNYSAKDNNAG